MIKCPICGKELIYEYGDDGFGNYTDIFYCINDCKSEDVLNKYVNVLKAYKKILTEVATEKREADKFLAGFRPLNKTLEEYIKELDQIYSGGILNG